MLFNKFTCFINLIILVDINGQLFRSRPRIPPKLAPFGSGPRSPTGLKNLGSYNIQKEKITMSGLSSGGTMAQQVQFSYSSLFKGIGVFSHTYYRCGPPNGVQADYDNVCTTLGNFPNDRLYNVNRAIEDIRDYTSRGLIDNPENLRNKKLYVYTGTSNFLFTTDMSLRILDIYEPLIRNPLNIFTRVQTTNLSLPSDSFGGPCQADSATTSFFIANCGLSGPYEMLNFLLGGVIKKPTQGQGIPRLSPLEEFDQSEFYADVTGRHDMDSIGYYYVPTKCKNSKIGCYLHFYFHGCSSGREFMLDNHIKNSGFLELAELNGIIMVFPQARSSPENDIGCWDTYGVTGPEYATKKGGQVQVIKNMLDRIHKKVQSMTKPYPVTGGGGSSSGGGSRYRPGAGGGSSDRQYTTYPDLQNPYYETSSISSNVRIPPRNRYSSNYELPRGWRNN